MTIIEMKNNTKEFDAIMENVKNRKVDKTLSIKIHSHITNLHTLIKKLLDVIKAVLKKDYRFDKVINIFEEIDNKWYNFNVYKPTIPDIIFGTIWKNPVKLDKK